MSDKKLSKERYLEIKKQVSKEINSNNRYIGFERYMMYALIRGKKISSICHSVETQKFKERLNYYFKRSNAYEGWKNYCLFNLTKEEFNLLIKNLDEKI